jgi:serine/threonine protein kinase
MQTTLGLYTIKSVMWQLLNGINCLHAQWIMHRWLASNTSHAW